MNWCGFRETSSRLLIGWDQNTTGLKEMTTRFFSATQRCFQASQILTDEDIQKETLEVFNDINRLKANIQTFDDFVLANRNLAAQFQRTLIKNSASIAQIPDADITPLNPDNNIDYLTLQKIEKIKLEHLLKERLVFVQSRPALMENFKQHFMQNRQNAELLQIQSNME